MEYDALSFVLSSGKRSKILKSLRTPATPVMISKEAGVTKEHVSRSLKDFVRMGLVVCKTPDKKKGKIFELTENGRKILNAIEEREKTKPS